MNLLTSLLRLVIARRDGPDLDEKVFTRTHRAPVNQAAIDEFLRLAGSTAAVDVPEKLHAFRQCDATIGSADVLTRQNVNNVAIPFVCRTLNGVELTKLSPNPRTFVRLVDEPNPGWRPARSEDSHYVFEKLIRSQDSVPHPSGVSSLTFAFGNIISLCASYPDRSDTKVNKVSGLLDLSPLYGLTEEDARSVRARDNRGRGYLLPDVFFEDGERLEFLPPATTVLLVLFSRNHNYIARRLFEENEKGNWVESANLEEEEIAVQDDQIFELARRINCGLLRNIAMNDFLKGLLGLSPVEENPTIELANGAMHLPSYHWSVEFSLVFSWLATYSEADTSYIRDIMNDRIGDTSTITVQELYSHFHHYASTHNMDKETRPCAGLERGDKHFADDELASILLDATESPAKAFRSRGTSSDMRVFEQAAIEQARQWEVCSFNEFRKALGLPEYRNFSEWTSDPAVAQAAEEIYGDINSLELYIGLLGEHTLDGNGFCLGRTITQGLITAITQMVRHDHRFCAEFTRDALTNWGYEELQMDVNNGAFGAFLPKLLLRNLPNNYTYNSIYDLFPFITPNKSTELLSELPNPTIADYQTRRPTSCPVHTFDDVNAIQDLFNAPEDFVTPYGEELKKITGGYGYLLGFDDMEVHERDRSMTSTALFPDTGALRRYAKFFVDSLVKLLGQAAAGTPSGSECQIDVVQDVINPTAARWAAEKLCGISLNERLTEKSMFRMLGDLNNYIFGNVEPQDHWHLRQKAINASEILLRGIERTIRWIRDGKPDVHIKHSQLLDRLRELSIDSPRDSTITSDFLAKLVDSGRDIKELSANTLGLAVLSSVHLAQACASALQFYLDDSQSTARERLKELAKQGPESNSEIMGYIREAMRLNPPVTSIFRVAATDTTIDSGNGSVLQIKEGDRICAHLKHTSGQDEAISPIIQAPSFQGIGFHKCLGVAFAEKVMPEVFKTIFRLEGLRKIGKGGTDSLIISFIKPGVSDTVKDDSKKRIKSKLRSILPTLALVFFSGVFVYWLALALGGVIASLNNCFRSSPAQPVLQPEKVYPTFPDPDNSKAPPMTTPQRSKTNRGTVIDIEERDLQFTLYIDEATSSEFRLDKSIDCRDRETTRVRLGSKKVEVIVPSGKQSVQIEWIGKDFSQETNSIERESERTMRVTRGQESC